MWKDIIRYSFNNIIKRINLNGILNVFYVNIFLINWHRNLQHFDIGELISDVDAHLTIKNNVKA